MGHDHSHSHGVTATGKHRKRLVAVLAITLAVVLVQTIGAVVSGSLALLADAGHMLSDAAGVFIALLAAWIATRPASDLRTYGYQRAEVLAALANALVLIVISVVIFTEAIRRLGATPEVHTDIMLAAAVLGAVANLVSLLILRGAQKESLNVRGAYLEVLGDLLGSFAVIAAAVVIMVTGFQAADTIASILIALMILPRAWHLLRDVVDVLLEATPKGVDVADDPRTHPGGGRRGVRPRHPHLDHHLRRPGLLRPRGGGGRGARRPGRRPGPGQAHQLPGLPFRHRTLHVPARARHAFGARGPPARLTGGATHPSRTWPNDTRVVYVIHVTRVAKVAFGT